MRILSLVAVSGLQLAAACRPGPFQFAGDGGPYVNERIRHEPVEQGRVRRDELLATDAPTLRDALTRTRPEFLRSTTAFVREGETATPVVYVDGRRLGGADVLQLIQVGEVAEVRLLRPAVARMLYGFGCNCPGGVIAVFRSTER